MKLKIICIVVVLVGTHFMASSNNCTTACNLKMAGTKGLKSTGTIEKKNIYSNEEEAAQLTLLPFHNLLFNL